MCQCYAAYLESKRYYEDASLMYERAGNMDSAVDMADKCLSWERAGRLGRAAGWGDDRLGRLYRGLAGRLEEAGREREAALVHRDWLNDSEEAVAVLARGGLWQEAMRQAGDISRTDLIGRLL